MLSYEYALILSICIHSLIFIYFIGISAVGEIFMLMFCTDRNNGLMTSLNISHFNELMIPFLGGNHFYEALSQPRMIVTSDQAVKQ